MKVKLTDFFGNSVGTTTTAAFLMVVATWCGLYLMHYHALLYHGIDRPIPDIWNAAVGVVGLIFAFYRKGSSDGAAGRMITQIDSKSEIKAVTEEAKG